MYRFYCKNITKTNFLIHTLTPGYLRSNENTIKFFPGQNHLLKPIYKHHLASDISIEIAT